MKEIHLTPGEIHMSRRVIEHLTDGSVRTHVLGCVRLGSDGCLGVSSFIKETPFTVYHDRELHIYSDSRLVVEE